MPGPSAGWPGLGGGALGGPLRAGLPAHGTPRVSTEPRRELSGLSLSGVSKRLGPPLLRLWAGPETPAGAFVFPSTTGLRKLLAGSRLQGLPAPGRWPYLMGAWPDPGFPACPGIGPKKRTLAVGGGRSLAPQAQLSSLNPRVVKCRMLHPKITRGSGSVSPEPPFPFLCLACAHQETEGLQWDAGVAQPPRGHRAPNHRFVLVLWCSEYSVLGGHQPLLQRFWFNRVGMRLRHQQF